MSKEDDMFNSLESVEEFVHQLNELQDYSPVVRNFFQNCQGILSSPDRKAKISRAMLQMRGEEMIELYVLMQMYITNQQSMTAKIESLNKQIVNMTHSYGELERQHTIALAKIELMTHGVNTLDMSGTPDGLRISDLEDLFSKEQIEGEWKPLELDLKDRKKLSTTCHGRCGGHPDEDDELEYLI